MNEQPIYLNVPSGFPLSLKDAYAEALQRWPDLDTHSGRERLKSRNIAGVVYQRDHGRDHFVDFSDLPTPSMSEYDEACGL